MHLTKFYPALTALLAFALAFEFMAGPGATALPPDKTETPRDKAAKKSETRPDSKATSTSEAKPDSRAPSKPVAKLDSKATSKSEAKPDSKAPSKPVAKLDSKATSKSEAKPDSGAASKPVAKLDSKVPSAQKKLTKESSKGGSSKLVPPPPPDTPSLMIDPSMPALMGMPLEYLGKESLKDREKEISLQYKDGAAELASRKAQSEEKVERARDFEALYTEGVVSRRELEQARRDADDAKSEISRLETKTGELKALLDRIHTKQAGFEKKTAQTEFNKLTRPPGKSSKSRRRTITQK